MKKFFAPVVNGQFANTIRLEDVPDIQAYAAAQAYDAEHGTRNVDDLEEHGTAYLNVHRGDDVTGRIIFQQDNL